MTVSHTQYDRNFDTKKMPIKLMIDTFYISLFVITFLYNLKINDYLIFSLIEINISLI